MNAEAIHIQGDKWRVFLWIIAWSWFGIVCAQIFLFHKPFVDAILIMLGFTIGAALITLTSSSILRKHDIIITSNHIEGPTRNGLFIKRHSILLKDVDFSKCKTPSMLGRGYITSSSGSIIYLASIYYDRHKAERILTEIKTRLT